MFFGVCSPNNHRERIMMNEWKTYWLIFGNFSGKFPGKFPGKFLENFEFFKSFFYENIFMINDYDDDERKNFIGLLKISIQQTTERLNHFLISFPSFAKYWFDFFIIIMMIFSWFFFPSWCWILNEKGLFILLQNGHAIIIIFLEKWCPNQSINQSQTKWISFSIKGQV